MKALVLITITLFLAGCPQPDGCTFDTLRCYNNAVEICNAGQMWETVADCNEFTSHGTEQPMTCVEWDQSEPECVEVD